MADDANPRARVVVLAGPSGSGKTRLAALLNEHHGWPILRLDDFYRDGDDPALPIEPDLGIPDWDHPDSWNAGAAVAALRELVDEGTTRTPTYDIATSRATGSVVVTAPPQALILAEGIFAAELIGPLRAAGLLHSAWCVVHRHRVLTFLWRLGRDLGERRKPPLILLRRGWALLRDEPRLVARQEALGATRATAARIETVLQASVGARR